MRGAVRADATNAAAEASGGEVTENVDSMFRTLACVTGHTIRTDTVEFSLRRHAWGPSFFHL